MAGSQLAQSLSEYEAGLAVHLEHLLNGVDIGCCPQVQTQLVLVGRSHDLLQQEVEGQVREGGAREDGEKSVFRCPILVSKNCVSVCVCALPWLSAPW